MTTLAAFGSLLRERQRWVLIALLAVFHLTLLAGADTAVGLMCWLMDVGFFILWQPFVQAERKVELNALLWFLLVLAAGIWLFSWWLLILWAAMLAALLGGRVLLLNHRPTRIFYLLAFAYLLITLLVYLVPRVVPDASAIGPTLDRQFAWAAPLILLAMLALPRPREIPLPNGGVIDFFYSVFLFLLIAVLILGSLAFMLLRQSLYFDAVFRTLVSIAAVLLLLAWAWNPRPAFSGVGVHLSRYLLTVGLPFESWLQRLMECAESESDPDRFLERALQGMLDLPWMAGGGWAVVGKADSASGNFGQPSRFRQDFPGPALTIHFFTRHKLSPSLTWLLNLLARLINEYYVTKQRARDLQQISYLRAVHETGARLTHDIKNLLQSLNNLCYMAQLSGELGDESGGASSDGDGGDGDGAHLNQLIQRQLPQITLRLQQTLEKLQVPQNAGESAERAGRVAAVAWWTGLQQRYAHEGIEFMPAALASDADNIFLPTTLFDSVADNLLHNALFKRQTEPTLIVHVTLDADAARLRICDNGSPVPQPLAAALMRAPVPSESGLGIGLYHASRQAENHGFELRLASNQRGSVCFELRRVA